MRISRRLVRLGFEWVTQYFELKHHGIKGQKRGVRHGPPYPIKRDGIYRIPKTVNFVSSNGIHITSFSKHVADRINENRPDRKVTTSDIVDSIRNPLFIGNIRVDDNGKKSQRFVGKKATSNVNPDTGTVTTVWMTGKRYLKKYAKKGL